MTENRNGLIVDVELTTAHGRAERDAALAMAERSLTPGATLGADKGYDAKHFVGRAIGWPRRAGPRALLPRVGL